ncbi:MAG: PEFG-CTERM sorting domain-containing protein [Nitrosopumilus sp.]|uniref:PEFG-CTERM sorting domain-containing protein n=1 Tax=Nitrosopumilus sp. TaxID=2024843 RepID=UPI00349FF023
MRIEKFVDFRIFYGIIVLLAISTGTVNAVAQTLEVSVQTDDNNYDEGDTIVISGNVSIVVGNTPITLQLFSEGNLIDIAQVIVAQDGSYSHTVIAEGPLWKKSGNYTVRASYGDGNIAEAEFSYSPKSAVILTTENFDVDAGSSGTFDVKYTIKGGTVKDMLIDEEIFALIVQIESTDEGVITLELPREFIGAEKQDGKDDKFIILIDAIEVDYDESGSGYTESRTITINFERGDSDIEIIGTYVIPEFGAITMMILIVGIMVTVLVARNKFQINI